MKKWKCTICGYIHEGDTPPEACPLCKAPAEQFEEVVAEGGTRRWKCTICGYIHEGSSPPEECPICKAGPDKFIEVDAEGNELAPAAEPAAKGKKGTQQDRPSLLTRLIMKFHMHPISVHMPNGILPVAVIFLAISIFLGLQSFEAAAFYNMVFVLLTMPVVLLTGYLEWKNRYQGAKTFVFFTKIICSAIVTVSLIVLVAWRFVEPGVAGVDSPFRLIYFGIAAVMLAATGIAGHLGGKLVFGTRKN
jgi:rubredoxin/uncharacterized membrane protein